MRAILNIQLPLLLALFTILSGCGKGDVSMSLINMPLDGIVIESPNGQLKTSTLSFSIKGRCAPELNRLYYRFNGENTWREVSNPGCGSPPHRFEIAVSESVASLRDPMMFGPSFAQSSQAEFTIEIYGTGTIYTTPTYRVPVLYRQKQSNEGFVASGETTLTLTPSTTDLPKLKIRGKLTAFQPSVSPIPMPNGSGLKLQLKTSSLRVPATSGP